MQIITVSIAKGGTGKSATAAALSQAAAAAGKKVLAIDLDPQANLSYFIGADQNELGAYQLFTGTPAAQLIQHTAQGIDAIAASPDLATLKTTPASAMRLRDAIAPIKESYDLIMIDTAPTIGEALFNALQASTGLLIPLETDNSSLQGLYQITDIASQIQRTNPALQVLGAILTRYDNRPKINRFMRDTIAEKGQEIGAPLLGEIRAGVSIREANAMQQSLFEYAPTSKPAQDYKALYDKIKKRGKQNGKKV